MHCEVYAELRRFAATGLLAVGVDAVGHGERRLSDFEQQFATDLYPMREVCRWTDGYWDFGPDRVRKWNEIQKERNAHPTATLLDPDGTVGKATCAAR